jgi:hypothetical protein
MRGNIRRTVIGVKGFSTKSTLGMKKAGSPEAHPPRSWRQCV